MKTDPSEKILLAIWADGRFPPEAFEFVQRGLAQTTRRLFAEEADDVPRHVTGQQLCEGLRTYALERWGLLAPVVLKQWNVRTTRDFGEIVYFLIEQGLMGRKDSDRLEDFDAVYDFDQAFNSYEIALDADEE